ncbi:hypothetical protein VTK73DRAFT_9450 [Phialemonium thermophilum]|uniref:Transmembrane protein n=1 Tax=Phialemonium thermophilum TaxID=223376 RepID=A0ABR3W263_9PEZI
MTVAFESQAHTHTPICIGEKGTAWDRVTIRPYKNKNPPRPKTRTVLPLPIRDSSRLFSMNRTQKQRRLASSFISQEFSVLCRIPILRFSSSLFFVALLFSWLVF